MTLTQSKIPLLVNLTKRIILSMILVLLLYKFLKFLEGFQGLLFLLEFNFLQDFNLIETCSKTRILKSFHLLTITKR